MRNTAVTGRTVPRRRFMKAGLAAPLVVRPHIVGAGTVQAPSDTLTVAAVGVGGMGRHYLLVIGSLPESLRPSQPVRQFA